MLDAESYSSPNTLSSRPPKEKIYDDAGPSPSRDMAYPVFLWTDYREYLRHYCEVKHSVRGLRRRLSEAAQCQQSYLSQVLQGEAHLSLDQLHGISQFLKFEEPEWQYWQELWLHSRAATPGLKQTIEKKLAALRQCYRGAVGAPAENLSAPKADQYFQFATSWHHSAVYVALEIPELRSSQQIARKLGLEFSRVDEVLAELQQMNLAEEVTGLWRQTTHTFVMDRFSPVFQIHRMFWYMRSLQKFFENPTKGYHGGICFSGSKKQLEEVQKKIQRLLFEIQDYSKTPESKTVAYLGLDLFEV